MPASAAIITAFLWHHYSRMSQKGREGSTTIFVTCDVLDSAITRIQDEIVNFAYRNSYVFLRSALWVPILKTWSLEGIEVDADADADRVNDVDRL